MSERKLPEAVGKAIMGLEIAGTSDPQSIPACSIALRAAIHRAIDEAVAAEREACAILVSINAHADTHTGTGQHGCPKLLHHHHDRICDMLDRIARCIRDSKEFHR